MGIRSVFYDGEKVKISYTTAGGSDEDKITFESSSTPRLELRQALNAFSGLMGVIAPEVNVVKVDIKTKYDAIIGFNVGCVWLKPDYDIATKTSVIDITGNEAEINKLCDEAKAYISGKRSQLEFNFSGGAEDE